MMVQSGPNLYLQSCPVHLVQSEKYIPSPHRAASTEWRINKVTEHQLESIDNCKFHGSKSSLGGLIFVEKSIPRKPRKLILLENFYVYGILPTYQLHTQYK